MVLCSHCDPPRRSRRLITTPEHPGGTRCERCPRIYAFARVPYMRKPAWIWVMPPADTLLRLITEDPS